MEEYNQLVETLLAKLKSEGYEFDVDTLKAKDLKRDPETGEAIRQADFILGPTTEEGGNEVYLFRNKSLRKTVLDQHDCLTRAVGEGLREYHYKILNPDTYELFNMDASGMEW